MISTPSIPESIDATPAVAVTDAKDAYDKCSKDATTWGAQKSLAFSVGTLR